MAKNPKSHQRGRDAEKAFDLWIPHPWVSRKQEPDYGLDFQVQIFDPREESTPFFFGAQVKGKGGVAPDVEYVRYSFETEDLREYLACPFPVMLVVLGDSGGRLFFEWVADVYARLNPTERRKWLSQKTATLSLARRLEDTAAADLEREVRQRCRHIQNGKSPGQPYLLWLEADEASGEAEEALREFHSWVGTGPVARHLSVAGAGRWDGIVRLAEGGRRLAFVTAAGEVVRVYAATDGWCPSLREMLEAMKACTAFLLYDGGLRAAALDVIVELASDSENMSAPVQAMLSVPSVGSWFGEAGRQADALMLAGALLRAGNLGGAQVLASAVPVGSWVSGLRRYGEEHRSLLRGLIEAGEGTNVGALHYSLANGLRCAGLPRDGAKHYALAARTDESYLARGYWWAEVGGCLFMLGKYRWAALAFLKAVDLGETRLPVRALRAESLLYAGMLGEASAEFSAYLSEAKAPFASAMMGGQVSAIVAACCGERVTRDPSAAEEAVLKASLADDEGEKVAILQQAIAADPLCGEAWCWLADVLSRRGLHDAAAYWTVGAMLCRVDDKAWARCVLALLGPEDSVADLLGAALVEADTCVGSPALMREVRSLLSGVGRPQGSIDAIVAAEDRGAARDDRWRTG